MVLYLHCQALWRQHQKQSSDLKQVCNTDTGAEFQEEITACSVPNCNNDALLRQNAMAWLKPVGCGLVAVYPKPSAVVFVAELI